MLNPENDPDIYDTDLDNNVPYIPVLDYPFSMNELNRAIINTNKLKSYTGVCPGVVGMLPYFWLLFVLTVFNIVFTRVQFPIIWCYRKLVIIFKLGNRMLCGIYRRISIIDSLAKIYDHIIMNRLLLWCNISK